MMSEGLFDVVVVGNIGIDTNIYLYGNEIDFSREANFSQNLDYIGQAGGYASRGYAALGNRTAFIGHVGQDFQGDFIRKELSREGINLDGLFVDPTGTSRSVNFMYSDGRRKNFYDGKGHMHLDPPYDVCERLFKRARLAHFNIPNWARKLLPLAQEAGVKIAVDLQDIVDLYDPYRLDFIEYANYLFFSAANHVDPKPLIEELLRGHPEQVIVSGMGAQGCMLGSHEGIWHFSPPEIEMPVVDTNGAGDSLAVGFLSAHVLNELPLPESILQGQIAARHCCSQKASTDHLIQKREMQAYLARMR